MKHFGGAHRRTWKLFCWREKSKKKTNAGKTEEKRRAKTAHERRARNLGATSNTANGRTCIEGYMYARSILAHVSGFPWDALTAGIMRSAYPVNNTPKLCRKITSRLKSSILKPPSLDSRFICEFNPHSTRLWSIPAHRCCFFIHVFLCQTGSMWYVGKRKQFFCFCTPNNQRWYVCILLSQRNVVAKVKTHTHTHTNFLHSHKHSLNFRSPFQT